MDNIITDKQNIEYLKGAYECVRRFATFDRDTARMDREITIQNYVKPTEVYDKVIVESRKFFLNFVKNIFGDERLIGDDYYEDLFDCFTNVFEKLIKFNVLMLEDNCNTAMDSEIYDMFKDVQARTNASRGSIRTVFAYIEDEINFQVMRYANGRVNIYDIDTDELWEY